MSKQVPMHCWKVDTIVLAASDVVPGMFATGASEDEAAKRYLHL